MPIRSLLGRRRKPVVRHANTHLKHAERAERRVDPAVPAIQCQIQRGGSPVFNEPTFPFVQVLIRWLPAINRIRFSKLSQVGKLSKSQKCVPISPDKLSKNRMVNLCVI